MIDTLVTIMSVFLETFPWKILFAVLTIITVSKTKKANVATFLRSPKWFTNSIEFIDQSKLRVEGHKTRQKFRIGRNRKVKVRVIKDSEADAGLSAFANEGEEYPIILARRKSRTIVAAINVIRLLILRLFDLLIVFLWCVNIRTESMTKETPRTVMPCSLLNIEHPAKNIESNK